jgi:hypothetical protein
MIQFSCQDCGKSHLAPEEFVGRKLHCKGCAAVLEIPPAYVPDALEDDVSSYIADDVTREDREDAEDTPAHGSDVVEDVVEDAVEDVAEETPEKPASGKRRFTPPKKKFSSRAKGGAGVKPERAGKSAKFASKRPGAARGRDRFKKGSQPEPAAAAEGGAKKKLLVAGAVVLGLLVALGGVYIYDPALLGLGSPAPRSGEARKVVARAADSEPEGAEDAEPAEEAEETEEAEEAEGEPAAADAAREPEDEPDTVARAAKIETLADPLDLIPSDADFILHVDLKSLLAIPVVAGLAESAPGDAGEDPLRGAMAKAGLDPKRDLHRLWVAGTIPPAEKLSEVMAAADPAAVAGLSLVAVVEGAFDEKKILAALRDEGLAGKETVPAGDYTAYAMAAPDGEAPGAEGAGYFTFLSSRQLLAAGSKELIAKAAKLEETETVRTNAALKTLTRDFSARSLFWLAARIPEGLIPQDPGAPALNIDGLFVSVDPLAGGEGLALKAALSCPSENDVANLQALLQVGLPGLPPEVAAGLQREVDGTTLRLSLDLPKALLESFSEKLAGALGGADALGGLDALGGAEGLDPAAGAEEMEEAEEPKEAEGGATAPEESTEESAEESTEENAEEAAEE